MYDIIIVGSGPAGAVTAALLNKSFKVLLLDKRELENPIIRYKEKPCGGLLNPDAQKSLAQLGWGLPSDILENPQMFAVRTMDFDNKCERFYQRQYYNIHRGKFEKWLCSHIPNSVEQHSPAVVQKITPDPEGYSVIYKSGIRTCHVRSRFIIGADGAYSKTRRELFVGRDLPIKYISLQEWYKTPETLPYYGAVFDKTVTDFYSWTITKGDNLIIGSALPAGPGAVMRFQRLKSRLREKGFHFGKTPWKREGALINRPRAQSQIFMGGHRAALAGEAAGLISPSSAEGFSFALNSAMLLAGALNAHGIEEALGYYKKFCRKLRCSIMLKNIKSPGMYNPGIRKVVMASGFGSLQPVPKAGYSVLNSDMLSAMDSRCS